MSNHPIFAQLQMMHNTLAMALASADGRGDQAAKGELFDKITAVRKVAQIANEMYCLNKRY